LTVQPITSTDPDRRRVLCGLAVALLVPGAVATACGSDSGDTDTGTGGSGGTGTPGTTGAPGTTDGGGASATGALAKLSDVPVGGGLIVTSGPEQILLVRLGDTQVVGYDPHCTHQRTIVDLPRDGVITCPQHGSRFNASDGSVVRDPATSPLRSVDVKVEGDSIVRA
jgi:cytochrome b6-f complex iron-sulfur subunit